MLKRTLTVYGRVQGVGFRAMAQQLANEFDLKGYAKNQPDTSVEIVVEGPLNSIAQYTEKIKNPPNPFARVEQVECRDEEKVNGYNRFTTH